MAINCTTSPISGCVSCPTIPATPGTPASVTLGASVGWNAGANSVAEYDGAVTARNIQIAPSVGGVVIGLRGRRALVVRPELVTHGLAFMSFQGVDAFRVIERGAYKTAATVRAPADRFEIRRQSNGQVSYFRNGELVHTSAAASTGVVLLTSCLYASGDAAGVTIED